MERIREIIVGRQLARLEQRVAILETAGPTNFGSHPPAASAIAEARLAEVRLELRQLVDENRDRIEIRLDRFHEETQRLAARIQAIATEKTAQSPGAGIRDFENKVGNWINEFQGSLKVHLAQRDQNLLAQFRSEISALWENTERQFNKLESNSMDRSTVEQRFERIAIAARALADSASSFTPNFAE